MHHRLAVVALALLVGHSAGSLYGKQAQAPAVSAAPVAEKSGTPLPKVLLLATGGTISNRTGGRLTADELVKSMPGLERYARAEAEQFANVASSDLSIAQWVDLARRINSALENDADLAGIVVTS